MKTLFYNVLVISFVLLIFLGGRSLAQKDSVGVSNQTATLPQQATPSQLPTPSMLNSIA